MAMLEMYFNLISEEFYDGISQMMEATTPYMKGKVTYLKSLPSASPTSRLRVMDLSRMVMLARSVMSLKMD